MSKLSAEVGQASPPVRPGLGHTVETLAWAALGGAALIWLNVPAGGVLGAMGFTAAACLAGRPLALPPVLTMSLQFLIGLAAGASFRGTSMSQLSAAALTIPLALLAAALMTAINYPIYRRIGRLDPPTAFCASVPGTLNAILMLGHNWGANLTLVALAQGARVVTLAMAVPVFLLFSPHMGGAEHHLAAAAAPSGDIGQWVLLIGAGLVATGLAWRLGLPVPAFLGPILASVTCQFGGWVAVAFPQPLLIGASIGLGAIVGTRFRPMAWASLGRLAPAIVLSIVTMSAISVLAGSLTAALTGKPAAVVVLAFAPGGLDTMATIALLMNLDPAFVAIHHLARVLVLLAASPYIARLLMPRAHGASG